MLYGAETVATKKEDVQRLAVNEMRMLRWSAGLTRKDQVPNEEKRMGRYLQMTQADEDAARGEKEKREAQEDVEGQCERRSQDAGMLLLLKMYIFLFSYNLISETIVVNQSFLLNI
ncbi:hypothetical protein ACOME3_002230 [Neoechinorhynchus agilis]